MENRQLQVSLCLIAINAENELQSCLGNIKDMVDEILLLDTGSTDGTIELANKLGARTFSFQWDCDFSKARNYVQNMAKNDWILWIDTDEYYPSELIGEIRNKLESENTCNGYYFPRRNYYFGKWLRFGGNFPDYQMKLYRKSAAKPFSDRLHESVKIEGKIGYFSNYCEHYSNPTVDHYLKKFRNYTTIEARILSEKGTEISVLNTIKWMVIKPAARFIKRYILKAGFLNGLPGFLAVVFDCLGYVVRYAKLWEIKRSRTN